MPELSLPMLLLPHKSLTTDQDITDLSRNFSDLIVEWLKANLVRDNEGILRFELTLSTGMTKTSMPLLKLHNLRLDTSNITFG